MLPQILPSITNPYLGTLVLGLMFGFTYCTFACAPYLVTYIGGVQKGFARGVGTSLIFSLGRVTAYGLLGGLAGILGGFLSSSDFQKYAGIAFGIIIIVIGISIFVKRRSLTCNHIDYGKAWPMLKHLPQSIDAGAFVMGVAVGLIPCPPLIAILLYSAAFFSPGQSIMLACLFGLGTTISPLLLIGGSAGWLSRLIHEKAPDYRGWVSGICGGILIFMGAIMLWRVFL